MLVDEPRWDPSRFPPTPRANRVIQTARLNRNPLQELAAARARLGPVFTLRIFPFRVGLVCATDPETNREVLTDQDRFVGGDAASLIEPIVGRHSLILTPPPRHMRNRKLLLPPFHGDRVHRWADRVQQLVNEQLPALLDAGEGPVRPWAQRLTLDVILEVVFGVTDPERQARFRAAVDGLMDPRWSLMLFAPEFVRRD